MLTSLIYENIEKKGNIHSDTYIKGLEGNKYINTAIKIMDESWNKYLCDMEKREDIEINLKKISNPLEFTEYDGMWVQNPDCPFLRIFARHDKLHCPNKKGFVFIGVLREINGNNKYSLTVDPLKNVNLRGLAEIINEEEHIRIMEQLVDGKLQEKIKYNTINLLLVLALPGMMEKEVFLNTKC